MLAICGHMSVTTSKLDEDDAARRRRQRIMIFVPKQFWNVNAVAKNINIIAQSTYDDKENIQFKNYPHRVESISASACTFY